MKPARSCRPVITTHCGSCYGTETAGAPVNRSRLRHGTCHSVPGQSATGEAPVTVQVHDDRHDAVSGATVSASWTGGYFGTASCTTDLTGRRSIATARIRISRPRR